jgi:uncharacterized protein
MCEFAMHTLAEALAALFTEARPAPASAAAGTPPAATEDWVRDALAHYNRAIEYLKSGDWAGFGAELDALRAVLENAGGHSSAP